jgi:acetyl/propionyl-CoA carboxylase alpha subunit
MNELSISIEGHTFDVDFERWSPHEPVLEVVVNGERLRVTVPDIDFSAKEVEWLIVGERPYEVIFDSDLRWLRAYGGVHNIEVRDRGATNYGPHSGDGRVKAPIPGLISRVLVEPGQEVEVGQPVVVLEAMKMENEIRAPHAGKVGSVLVAPDDSVTRGAILVEIV